MNRENLIGYEIYIKSFCDSNNDGVGDIKGIISKLDYLKDLGINYLWLTPFYLSPQKDNGYDVTDYYSIDPMFGNLNDFNELVKKAEEKGISIMLDMVLNHSSITHEWFQKALKGSKKHQDYYHFKDNENNNPPTNWESKFGGNAWEYVESLNKWYLHLFDVTQADFNWENKELRNELFKVVNFWKKHGVKGFRFDVINLISKPEEVWKNDYKGDGRRFYTDGVNVHKYIKKLNENSFGKDDGFQTVAELSSTDVKNVVEYTKPENNEFSMAFNFHHLKIDYDNGNKWKLKKPDFKELHNLYKEWQEELSSKNGWMANFLSNHDQPRQVSRFGDDKNYHYESATALATMYILLKGSPYIYYGEEIGMTNPKYSSIELYGDIESQNYFNILVDVNRLSEKEALKIISERSRVNGRVPMYWNSSNNAGFSENKPWLTLGEDYININVEKQINDPNSILSFYKKIIELRKTDKVFSLGDVKFDEYIEDVILYKRYTNKEARFVYVNLSSKHITLPIKGEVIINNYSSLEKNILKPYQAIVTKEVY